MIKQGTTFLMMKIYSPNNVDFFKEHEEIIEKNGFVWFCRFGRSNLRIDSISKYGNYIFIKESMQNGNGKYLLTFDDIQTEQPSTGFPIYYNSIDKQRDIWFKVTSIKKLDDSLEDHFRLASSGGTLDRVYNSMCNSFYIVCKSDFSF